MDCLIGIKFKDFVMVAADASHISSIIVAKNDEQKLHQMTSKLVMAISGRQGDTVRFADIISKNLQLYKIRRHYELQPKEACYFTRRTLADTLRTRDHSKVNVLLAGYDDVTGPMLYFVDYLAAMVEVEHATHGYGGLLSLSVLDRFHMPVMDVYKGYELMEMCVKEVQFRLALNLPKFQVRTVGKDGVLSMPPITAGVTEL